MRPIYAVSLTEEDVIRRALSQNLGVQIAKLEGEAARAQVLEAKSAFDTVVALRGDHLIEERDQAIAVFGTDNRQTNFNLGVARRFLTGTELSIEWLNQRSSTNSPFVILNPYFASDLGFSLKQPLLNNFFGKQDRGRVRIAKNSWKSADAFTRRKVAQNVYGVLYEYWRWKTDAEIILVAEDSLKEAKKFEEGAGRKKFLGLYESTDVLSARANRLRAETFLADARKREQNSLGRLKRALGLGLQEKVESNEKMPFYQNVGTVEESLKTALENRSDYLAVKSSVEVRKIVLSLAKNSRWPELDLVASLNLNGVQGDWDGALSEIRDRDHPSYLVGGELTWIVENRFARGQALRGEKEKAKALLELKDVENQITQEVEETWREIQVRYQETLSHREIQQAYQDRWRQELDKFQKGRSSSDLVIRFQEDYWVSERQALESLLAYRMAILGLRLMEETLL